MANLRRPSLHFYLGLAAIMAGFVCLRLPTVDGVWTLTCASVLLVAGFVVLVPYGLWPRRPQNSSRPSHRADREALMKTRLAGVSVFAASVIVYLLTLWPGPGWWDSSNYILCSYTLGVTSPPGSILLQLLGRIASYFSVITSPAIRVNGLVAVISALSATVVYFTTVRLLQSPNPGRKQALPAAVIGGVLAALTLAFAESVWSHATFANPYALSPLMAALMMYLAVRWWEDPDAAGAGNFLLLAAFLFGLDLSVHRSNLLLAPAFLLAVFLRRPKALLDVRLWTAGVLLFSLGLSMQLTVMFRAQLSPVINLGNPDDLSSLWNYLTLSQFGIKTFGTDLLQRKGPFWDYQIKEMYLRYFGWNFVGMDSHGTGVNWAGLWAIPAITGIAGFAHHIARQRKQALFLLAAFLMASIGAIIYLNVPSGFFREMDRHFLVSFMLFSLWVGVGGYAALRLVSRFFGHRPAALWILAGVLLVVLPANVLVANWPNNNQSSNHTSYNFGYNLLETCEQNAILITAGDNDTFLPWYLQIIEGTRPDVTVLNLPLLNTEWYLRTTMSYHPNFPWSLNEDSLRNLRIIPWETDTVTIIGAGPDSVALSIVVEPTFAGKYLLVQDQVLLNILRHNRFERPIYFSGGFGRGLPLNLIGHCRLDGLAWRLVPQAEERSDYRRLENNLLRQYDYEGFGKQTFLDRTGRTMASKYHVAFTYLAQMYEQQEKPDQLHGLEAKFDDLWPDIGGEE